MSLALKQSKMRMGMAPTSGAMISRRAYMGDPGLFGFLGKVAGGIAKTAGGLIPGPVGGVLSGAGDILSGGGQPRTARPSVSTVTTPPITRGFQDRPAPINIPGPIGGPGAGFPFPFARGGRASFGENGGQPTTKLACPAGFHPNKSDYFLKDGTFVPKGSKCVKNRRTNPLNPKAASRSIRRLEQAKRAVKRLDRVNIKCKRCGYSRCRC